MSKYFVESVAPDRRQRFDEMFELHHRDVVRYCVRRLGASDGQDVAAEVFVVAWRRLDEVPDGDATRVWLLAVAYRAVGNEYRSRARRGRLVARLSGMRGHDHPPLEVGEAAEVAAALEAMRPRDREVLRMVAWDELSRSEIARVLGIAENAVDQRLFRARARLKIRLSRATTGEGMRA